MIDPVLLQNLSGVKAIVHPLATTEAPARQHKKRRNQSASYHARVQKKWTKRFGKKLVPGAVLFSEQAHMREVPERLSVPRGGVLLLRVRRRREVL